MELNWFLFEERTGKWCDAFILCENQRSVCEQYQVFCIPRMTLEPSGQNQFFNCDYSLGVEEALFPILLSDSF